MSSERARLLPALSHGARVRCVWSLGPGARWSPALSRAVPTGLLCPGSRRPVSAFCWLGRLPWRGWGASPSPVGVFLAPGRLPFLLLWLRFSSLSVPPPLPSPPRTFRSLSPRSPRLQCAARGFLPCYVSCALLFSLLFLPFLTAPCVLTRLAAPPGLGDGLLGLRALTCGRPRVYLAACPALGLDFACSARRSALPPSSPPSFPAPFGA